MSARSENHHRAYDVLVYGPMFCDLIFVDLPAMPQLGTEIFAGDFTVALGGSAIVAVGLQRLGARVGLIADLGADPMSDIMRDMLDDLGIDRTLIREHPYPLPQVTVGLSFPQDRAFVTRFQKPEKAVDLAAVLRDFPARHLHLGSFLGALDNPAAAAIAHRAGLTVSFDPGWDETALHDPRVQALIAETDVFLPSQSELCHIARTDNVAAALAQISAHMPDGLIVLKQGADGATAYRHDTRLRVPALPVNPIDTTGAGDSFDAGFLFRYVQGDTLANCLRYGAVCGALSTTRIGGATAAPTHEEVESWLTKLPS